MQFEVAIWHGQGKMSIIASNMQDKRDFFEINVDGQDDVEAVLKKFDYNYLLIADSLRIMNDVMVLLNPKIIQNQRKSQAQ